MEKQKNIINQSPQVILVEHTLGKEEPDFKSRNMKIIKSGGVKFYAPAHQTPESVIDDLENIYHRTKFYALIWG